MHPELRSQESGFSGRPIGPLETQDYPSWHYGGCNRGGFLGKYTDAAAWVLLSDLQRQCMRGVLSKGAVARRPSRRLRLDDAGAVSRLKTGAVARRPSRRLRRPNLKL